MVNKSTSSNIVLTGFMGSGKSYIGKALAQSLEREFYDTDSMIETQEKRTIASIFASEGESYFRSLETQLTLYVQTHIHNAIISTGGGMPIYCDSIDAMGIVFFIDVPFETIVSRMSDDELSKRPLFNDIPTAKALYEKRRPIYIKHSHYQIDGTMALEDIIKYINKINK